MNTLLDIAYPLIAITFEHQKRMSQHVIASDLSPRKYLNEYCTVKLGGPRGCGHTHIVTALGNQFPDQRLLMITGRTRFVPILRSHMQEWNKGMVVANDNPNWERQTQGHRFNGVVLDTAGQMSRGDIETAYDLAESHVRVGEPFLFLILG